MLNISRIDTDPPDGDNHGGIFDEICDGEIKSFELLHHGNTLEDILTTTTIILTLNEEIVFVVIK